MKVFIASLLLFFSMCCFLKGEELDAKSNNDSEPVFLLIISDKISEETIKRGENGEVYIDADNIIGVGKDELPEIISNLTKNSSLFIYRHFHTNNSSETNTPDGNYMDPNYREIENLTYWCNSCKKLFLGNSSQNYCSDCHNDCEPLTINHK